MKVYLLLWYVYTYSALRLVTKIRRRDLVP